MRVHSQRKWIDDAGFHSNQKTENIQLWKKVLCETAMNAQCSLSPPVAAMLRSATAATGIERKRIVHGARAQLLPHLSNQRIEQVKLFFLSLRAGSHLNHIGTRSMFLCNSCATQGGAIFSPFISMDCTKSNACTTFKKCTALNLMVLWYHLIWCKQMHCVCDRCLGCRQEYIDICSRSHTQCIVNTMQKMVIKRRFLV